MTAKVRLSVWWRAWWTARLGLLRYADDEAYRDKARLLKYRRDAEAMRSRLSRVEPK